MLMLLTQPSALEDPILVHVQSFLQECDQYRWSRLRLQERCKSVYAQLSLDREMLLLSMNLNPSIWQVYLRLDLSLPWAIPISDPILQGIAKALFKLSSASIVISTVCILHYFKAPVCNVFGLKIIQNKLSKYITSQCSTLSACLYLDSKR